jgi:alkanesulfonate monooxygenase SsuD/methylene tetrahydromethanopterin reductase-like flavin-dependent oxidoreductase (luciferase family)
MRFGVFTLGDNAYGERSDAEMLHHFMEEAVLADRLGFHSAWIGEHHFTEILLCPIPEVFLANLLARTERIKVGCAIHVLPLNHPVRLAETYAMLDILAPGRVIFGAGKGFFAEEFEGFNVPLAEASEWFEETLEIIIRCWTDEVLNYEGKFYTFRDLRVLPKPVTQPHPPVAVAVISPPSFEYCARRGYSIMVAPFSLLLVGREEMKRRVQDFYRLAAEYGNRDVEVTSSWFLLVTEDPEEQRIARSCMERYLRTVAPALASDRGSRGPRYEQLRKVLSDITFRTVAESGSGFVGGVKECIERLKQFEEMGIREVYCYFSVGGMPQELVLKSMRLFAEEVMPHFQEDPVVSEAAPPKSAIS